MNTEYESKLFRAGNILLALALAIRGIPRTWQAEERPVTRESGWAIYVDEIDLLDPINPQLRIFQSGVLAAALITLALDPAVITFWEAVNEERWTRHKDGRYDPAGWLLQQILRHSGNREIALRPEYQHYLFQVALAAALAWSEGEKEGKPVWLRARPSLVAIDELIETVRRRKNLRRTADGFRFPRALAGRIPVLGQSVIEHTVDLDLAEQMARQAAVVEAYSFDQARLSDARMLLEQLHVPAELAAPGALTACLVSLACDQASLWIWQDTFSGRWSHDPDLGSDVVGLVTRSIQLHNRRHDGMRSEAQLVARIMMAIKSYTRRALDEADPRAHNIPMAHQSLVDQLVEGWAKLPLPSEPDIHVAQIEAVLKGHSNNRTRPACRSRRGKGRDKTGRRSEQAFERYHKRCSLPRAGDLIDVTRDQSGCDYVLKTPTEPDWYFEVKTIAGRDILITERQWAVAEEMGDRYWLVLVGKGSGEEILFLQNPAATLRPRKETRRVVQTLYKVDRRQWRQAARK